MSLKQAAEDLLKIADEIEAQADSVTNFVCNQCNHTATLAKINEKRKTAAESQENVTVSPVTVNDQVACPACDDGVMVYAATKDSEKFYIDEKEVSEEAPKQETRKEASEPIDYDSLKRYQA